MIVKSLNDFGKNLLEEEKKNNSVHDRSFVALIVVGSATVNEGDTSFAMQQIQILREVVPDLKILFFSSGAPVRFRDFVQNENRDLFQLRQISDQTDTTSITSMIKPIIERFQQSKYIYIFFFIYLNFKINFQFHDVLLIQGVDKIGMVQVMKMLNNQLISIPIVYNIIEFIQIISLVKLILFAVYVSLDKLKVTSWYANHVTMNILVRIIQKM